MLFMSHMHGRAVCAISDQRSAKGASLRVCLFRLSALEALHTTQLPKIKIKIWHWLVGVFLSLSCFQEILHSLLRTSPYTAVD